MHLSFLKKKKRKKKLEWNCGNGIAEFHSTFHNSKSFFFTPYFGNVIATIAKNLYPLFWQCHCRKLFFFPPIFGNGIATIANFFFFSHHLVFLAPTHTSSTHSGSRYEQKELRQYHCWKSKILSLLLFIFLSPTFVEFRQWYCRNSLSFLRLLNNLKQYL